VALNSPWYSSGTFWAGVGAVAAVLAVIVTIVLWRVGSPRRRLELRILTITPLLSRHGRGPELSIWAEGAVVSDPYVVIVRLRNRSRRDIRSSDFDQGKFLVLDFQAPIVALEVDGGARLALDSVRWQSDTAQVGPALIGGRQDIRLTVITDGEPAICWESPLVGVDIESSRRDPVFRLVGALALAGSGGLLTGIVIALYGYGHRPFPGYLQPGFVALVTALFLLSLIVMLRAPRG
jgi:hypothetical protein